MTAQAAPTGPAAEAASADLPQPITVERIDSAKVTTLHASQFDLDAVELDEPGNPRLASATLYILLAFIVAAITWASVSSVDKIIVAPGKLITTTPNIVVQPLETSIVRSIEVSVGDVVRAGQLLARLDSTFSQSDVEQLRAKAEAHDARIRRLSSEIAGDGFTLGAAPTSGERLEARLFEQRAISLDARLKSLSEAEAKAQAEMATAQAELPLLERRLATMREIEGMRQQLYKMSIGSRLNLLISSNERLNLEAGVARMTGQIVELRHAVLKTRSEHDEARAEFRRSALEELIKTRDEVATVTEQIKKAKLRQQLVDLTSPIDAVVLELAKRSVGSVLREAEPFITLVPIDATIGAEVSISPRDIGRIKAGQSVRVKFDTFPFQQHGTASGIVQTVSNDAFQTEPNQQAAAGPQTHFRARVELTSLSLKDLPAGFRPMPGMTVIGEVKVGDRTIISYFLYPILRGLDESIREP